MAGHQVLVCPGDRLCSTEIFEPGEGTYVYAGSIYASVLGAQQELHTTGAMRPTLQIVANSSATVVPRPGDTVTVRVSRVQQNAAHCQILCVGPQPLDVEFKGVIRQQDVRATEIDKVVMYESFRPGDTVRAEVLSLGDARSYYLTTAKNELGVVYATSVAGVAMVPISWQEMQCPSTHTTEKRKVAKT